MKISFTERGWEDYTSWCDDRKMLRRINRLVEESARQPGLGVGKPERLAGDLSGSWSRRIDHEHRLVYLVSGDRLVIVAARYHY